VAAAGGCKDSSRALLVFPDWAGKRGTQGGSGALRFRGRANISPYWVDWLYSVALLSGAQPIPLTLGFLVVGGFLLLSYWHKLSSSDAAGVTSEMSGLATFLVGALVYYEHFWIATALSVASLLLLELKTVLEKLAGRIPPEEILTFAKFLLLTAVILPILPKQEFGRFHINPFKTWLVVVAVSTISYGSYVLQKLTKNEAEWCWPRSLAEHTHLPLPR
jgi:hypothetical protein